MGASQSSSTAGSNGTGSAAATEVKTSYYDLLGISHQATEEDIKKAWKKKALSLHPDRNYGNEAEATKTFSEVQAAYEILSDPQERAWYDSHESAILRGDDGNGEGNGDATAGFGDVKMTSAEEVTRLVRKFNSGIEFSDAPSGFYGFLRETFEGLAKEEVVAARWEGANVPDYPGFGHKSDGHEDGVKQFYAAWGHFSTVKGFGWRDKWRLAEAPDRRVRRLMEKENAELRREGIREFNESVRSLVAFVRKRDPRFVVDTRSEAERQETLRSAAAAQAARARKANQAKVEPQIAEWANMREDDDELNPFEVEEEESDQEVFECVACSKVFKSEKQWEAHEKSKKHQKAVFALQKKMRKDNANLDLDGDGVESGVLTPADEGVFGVASAPAEANGHIAPQRADDSDDLTDSYVEDFSDLDGEAGDQINDSDHADDAELRSNGKANGASFDAESSAALASAILEPGTATDTEDEDSDYASPDAVTSRLANATLSPNNTSSEDTTSTQTPDADAEADPSVARQDPQPKIGKAALKRAKKAAQAAAEGEIDKEHACATCQAKFESGTQLHQHIKTNGHAAPKTVYAGSGKGKIGQAAKKGKGKKK